MNARPPWVEGRREPSRDATSVSSLYSLPRGWGAPRSADEDTEAIGQFRWPEEG